MKAYVSDTKDLKHDPLYQETLDDFIINVSSSIFTNVGNYIRSLLMEPSTKLSMWLWIVYAESNWEVHKMMILLSLDAFFSVAVSAETLDVIQDTNWVILLGNIFAKQYKLYKPNDEHSTLLHRYLRVEFLLLSWPLRYICKNNMLFWWYHIVFGIYAKLIGLDFLFLMLHSCL